MIVDQPVIDTLLRGAILAGIALVWAIALIRLNGLRSLSKMTSFDFVMTVALGSLVAGASQAETWLKFGQPLTAMAGLFALQWSAARLRKASSTAAAALQNEPVLLMRDGAFLPDAMARTRVTEDDLVAKLREANVVVLAQVRAAVLETTGDVSVLHGDRLEPSLLRGVRRAGA